MARKSVQIQAAISLVLAPCGTLFAQPAALPPVTAPFVAETVAPSVDGGYQLLAIDVDHDGRTDLIGLGLKATTLTWYENPSWAPHVIVTTRDAPDMVIMDAADLDRDGIPELALAYRFNANPTLAPGAIGILHHDGDPRGPWTLREIGRVPATHRLALADVAGDGTRKLVAAPILAETATGFHDPDHHATPLYLFDPASGARSTISEDNRGVVHGMIAYDWFGSGRMDPITAGYSGVWVHHLDDKGLWRRTQLTPGDPAPWPGGGASDVAIGTFAGRRFFVTVEPFHGNKLVVYLARRDGGFDAHVIDDTLQAGHALTLVDVDRDGRPEIVAGGNRSKTNLYFYKAVDRSGTRWSRNLMDNDMAAVSCVTADLTKPGIRTDIACIDARPPFSVRKYRYIGK